MGRWITCLFAAGALAQTQTPAGIVRGRVIQVSRASLQVETNAGVFVQCSVDSQTYLERDGQRIFLPAIRVADPVELIADRKAETCYARTVRVVMPGTRMLPIRPSYRSLDYVFPRGNLTFAGVVRRLNSHLLVLRTKEEPERLVLLREDTRFLESGFPADLSRLAVNTRVFIRGGRNIDNDLEAYQVIWGEIAGPRPEDH